MRRTRFHGNKSRNHCILVGLQLLMLRVAHELSQRAVPFMTSKLYDLVRYVTENNDTKGIILVCMRQRQDEKEER